MQGNTSLRAIKGIKGTSCLVALEDFDLVNGFTIDYMHNVLLGVFKSLLNFWLDPAFKKEMFYIKKKNKLILDVRLLSIRKCSFISRPIRSISKLANFKANELRSLLLFYLPSCLVGLLPAKYIDHLQILSSSIYRLLKSQINHNELNSIEENLNQFVAKYQFFYGKQSMTMNIHLITHIVESVRNNGPLWTTSMFAFESNNGNLLKMFNGTRDLLQQISTKYMLKHEQHVKSSSAANVIDKRISLSNVTKIKIANNYSEVFINMGISVPHDDMSVYAAINIGTEQYTSVLYTRAKKSCNYVVRFNNNFYGQIHFFFKSNNIDLMMVELFTEEKIIDHIVEVSSSKLLIAEIAVIDEKLLFFKVGNRNFISFRPNMYEKD